MLGFPEGTRGDGVDVRPFKTGSARMAIEAKVPIIPVGIGGTERVMAAKSWVARPGPLHFEVGPPIEVDGMGFEGSRELSESARQAVASLREVARTAIA